MTLAHRRVFCDMIRMHRNWERAAFSMVLSLVVVLLTWDADHLSAFEAWIWCRNMVGLLLPFRRLSFRYRRHPIFHDPLRYSVTSIRRMADIKNRPYRDWARVLLPHDEMVWEVEKNHAPNRSRSSGTWLKKNRNLGRQQQQQLPTELILPLSFSVVIHHIWTVHKYKYSLLSVRSFVSPAVVGCKSRVRCKGVRNRWSKNVRMTCSTLLTPDKTKSRN